MPGPNDIAIITVNKDYQHAVRAVDFAHRNGEAFWRIATTAFAVPERNIVMVANAGFGRFVELFGYEGRGSQELTVLVRAKDTKVNVFYFRPWHDHAVLT